MKFILLFFCILLQATLAQGISSSPKFRTELPIKNLAVGELGHFTVISLNGQLTKVEQTIQLNGFSLTLFSSFRRNSANRSIEYVYNYQLSPTVEGTFTIPKLTFTTQNSTFQTEEITFHVHPLSSFDSHQVTLDQKVYSYYSKQFLDQSSVVIKQPVLSEVRFLIPATIKMYRWGLATPQFDSSVVGWRYQGPTYTNRNYRYSNSTSLLITDTGKYTGASYQSILSGLKKTKTTLGQFKITATSTAYQMTAFGKRPYEIIGSFEANPIPLNITALPEGAPKLFKGDVGVFQMQATLPDVSSISANDSIKISLTISGEGSLHTLQSPSLLDPENWKIIDISKRERGEERKEKFGEVTFDLLLSPLASATKTPKIAFCYYNPEMMSYQNLYAPQLPISLTSKEQPVVKPLDPSLFLENQQDILGFLPNDQASKTQTYSLPFSWHYIPSAFALSIVLFWLYRKQVSYRANNADTLRKQKAYKNLLRSSNQPLTFYKEAGSYIEQWVQKKEDPTVQEILHQRDQSCYQPEKNQPTLSKVQKKKFMKMLKQLSLLLLLFQLSSQPLEASFAQAIETKDYQTAITESNKLSDLTANQHYNLANCYYKTNQAGLAALHYHKAILLKPNHAEAKQNLRFLESQLKPSSIEELTPLELAIEKKDKSFYNFTLQLSIWIFALSLLALFLLRPKSYKAISLISLAFLACISALSSFLAIKFYPKSIYFSPIAELSVVTELAKFQTEPLTPISEKSTETSVIATIVPSSLCKVLLTRGQWSYIELTTGTRGWMKSQFLKSIAEQP